MGFEDIVAIFSFYKLPQQLQLDPTGDKSFLETWIVIISILWMRISKVAVDNFNISEWEKWKCDLVYFLIASFSNLIIISDRCKKSADLFDKSLD